MWIQILNREINLLFKKISFILLFIFYSFLISGQNSYYIKDSVQTVGIMLIDGGEISNSKICQIQNKNEIIVFSPEEVNEYGFRDGRKYISRVILIDSTEKKVFLEKLSTGIINLYYYKDNNGKKYFFEKGNGTLFEIKKHNNTTDNYSFREEIKKNLNDCSNVSEATDVFNFNKKSLKKLIDQYNNCEKKYFPFTEFGVFIGYSKSNPIIFKFSYFQLEQDGFIKSYAPVIGFLINIPINLSNYSFYTGLEYHKNKYTYHHINESNTIYNNINDRVITDISINLEAIDFPFLIRYKFNYFKFKPFINAGATFSYTLTCKNLFSSTNLSNNVIEIEKINHNYFNFKNQLGLSIGGGMQYKLSLRNSLFIELRYNNLYSIKKESFGSKSIQLLMGLNF